MRLSAAQARKLGIEETPSMHAGSVTYRLPLPPSTNNLFATVRGRRVKSKEYKAWLQEAGRAVDQQGMYHVLAPVRVHLRIKGGAGFSRARDLDNALKPVLDLLVSVCVLAGDTVGHAPRMELEYTEDRSGAVATCEVEISRIEATS